MLQRIFLKNFEIAINEMMDDPKISFKDKNGPLNSNSGKALTFFYYATKVISALNYEHINELFDNFSKQSGKKGDIMK